MRKNSIILLLSAVALIGCSSSNKTVKLPSVEENVAVERVATILANQKAEGFAVPNAFSIRLHNVEMRNDYTFDGKLNHNQDKIQEFAWDLDKIACREYNKVVDDIGYVTSTEEEHYYFYDEKEGKICRAHIVNGYKYYDYDDNALHAGKENALAYLIQSKRDRGRGTVVKYSGGLQAIGSRIEAFKEIQEKVKDKKDQHANIYFGSADEHSVQVFTDIKVKETLTGVDSKFEYTGYTTDKYDIVYENDLLTKQTQYTSMSYTAENGKYYANTKLNSEITVNKTKSNFTIPDLSSFVNEETK